MNVSCSHCGTTYRVDPAKVPASGVRARCSHCGEVFPIAPAVASAPEASPAPEPRASAAPPQPEPPAPQPESPTPPPESPATAGSPTAPPEPAPAAPVFGSADPQARARRLARALVSDIAVYHPERRERSLQNGTLRQEFREEIRKSWEEYVAQVGGQLARETPYFREALNEILARGQPLF